jgi:hypothetical protein
MVPAPNAPALGETLSSLYVTSRFWPTPTGLGAAAMKENVSTILVSAAAKGIVANMDAAVNISITVMVAADLVVNFLFSFMFLFLLFREYSIKKCFKCL